MKHIRKLVGLILAASMLLTMSGMSVLAASSEDTATVKITNLDENASVQLYKIASAAYNAAGDTFTGYDYVDGASFANEAEPTSQEINDIAAKLLGEGNTITPVSMTVNAETGTATATVAIGRYIAIVSSADTSYVYNPVLLTAGYKLEGDEEAIYGGSVDITGTYAYGDTAVAKSSTVKVDKEAEGYTDDVTAPEGSDENQTVGIGDVIKYIVSPTLPDYPDNATNKTFFVTDTMDAGLTFLFETLEVTWNGETIRVGENGNFTASDDTVIGTATEGENGYMIIFDYDALDHDDPVIRYSAVVNENAVIGTAEGNKNEVVLYYSNNPLEGNTWTPDEIPGPNTDLPEGVQKRKDEVTVYTYRVAFLKTDDAQDPDEPKPLEGAVFGIYSDADCKNLVDIVTTNESGFAESVQVAAGTYYLKEISAPAGYSLNTNVYPVTASYVSSVKTTTATTTRFTYTDNPEEALAGTSQVGWLAGVPDADGNISYDFYAMDEFDEAGTTDDGRVVVEAYIASATKTTQQTVDADENEQGGGLTYLADSIKDSTLNELPSTGGRGVYLFIIIGVAIMSTIAFAALRGSRKQA